MYTDDLSTLQIIMTQLRFPTKRKICSNVVVYFTNERAHFHLVRTLFL